MRERGSDVRQSTDLSLTPHEGPQPLRAHWDPLNGASRRTGQGQRPSRDGARRRSRLGWALSLYGWRVLSIPVLVVLTVLAVVDTVATKPTAAPAPAAAPGAIGAGGFRPHNAAGAGSPISGPVADGSFNPATAAGTLPDGGSYPTTGAGTWHIVPGTTPQVGAATATLGTDTVEVEDGMDTTGFGGDAAVASVVAHTLGAPQGWTHDGRFAFRRVDSGTPTFRISLTSATTVRPDTECGYQVPLETSCFNAVTHRVILNAARWVRGALSYQGDVGSYRPYMINHEVGHALGLDHQPCPAEGAPAPVMMQQTFGIANNQVAHLDPQGVVAANGFTCLPNPWPFPQG